MGEANAAFHRSNVGDRDHRGPGRACRRDSCREASVFVQTDLDVTLRDMLVDQLVIFGVVTNICVRSTVHDAFFNGYEVVVPRDCCAATGAREQESTLYDIATHFGVVTEAECVVAALTMGAIIANIDLAA